MAFVPEPNKIESKKETVLGESVDQDKIKFSPTTIMYGVLILFLCIFYMIVLVKLPQFVTESNLGSASEAGSVLSFMQIANMITGFLFGFIYKVLKKLTLPISIFLMALGLLLVMTANNLFVVGIGAVLNGVSFAIPIFKEK